MNRFKTTLTAFMAALPLFSDKGIAANIGINDGLFTDRISPVQLRPLNFPEDNLFAAHRSHSSHSSHSSHRSSSGGGYAYPSPTPPPVVEPEPSNNSLYGTPSPDGVVNTKPLNPAPTSPARFTIAEKRQLQIMRVQIALTSLGLYSGHITGELDSDTKDALKRVQVVKGVEPNGLMSTETLNALGVPAVQ